FIDGQYVDALDGATFETNDPATGDKIGDVAKADRADAQRAIEAARKAFDDVPGAASSFRWFARMAEEQPDEVELEGSPFPPSQNWKRYEPYGVTTGI